MIIGGFSVDGYLKIMNIVEFEHYIAGLWNVKGDKAVPWNFIRPRLLFVSTYTLNNLQGTLGNIMNYAMLCIARCIKEWLISRPSCKLFYKPKD